MSRELRNTEQAAKRRDTIELRQIDADFGKVIEYVRDFAPDLDAIPEQLERIRARMLSYASRPKLVDAPRPTITRAHVIHGVAMVTKYGIADLKARCRLIPVVRARQAAMLLMRRWAGATLSQIGATLSRDHSTVMAGIKAATQMEADDPSFQALIEAAFKAASERAERQFQLGESWNAARAMTMDREHASHD